MRIALLTRFLCFIGLHAYCEDPTCARVRCLNCGVEKDLVYPPCWRGFRKPAPSSVQRESLPVKPLPRMTDRPIPAEREVALAKSENSRIEHLTRESLGVERGKSA